MEEKMNVHHRISYRAQWHKYDGGMYFVTICTKEKQHFFGEIADGVMNLSEIGKCLHEQIVKTPSMRADMNVEIPSFVIMPNHVHLIVIIGENQYNTCRGTMHCAPTDGNGFVPQTKNLASIIRGIKISTTTFARKNDIPFAWQSRYYDRIIRDSAEMNRIAEYIENNVAEWDENKGIDYQVD